MPYGKPRLGDGILLFLDKTQADHQNFGSERFVEIMNYKISDTHRVLTITKESGVNRNTVWRWVNQWNIEQEQ